MIYEITRAKYDVLQGRGLLPFDQTTLLLSAVECV